MEHDNHQVIRFPSSRFGTIDLGRIGGRTHHVAGLIEVDVTDAMRSVAAESQNRGAVSFFAWMVRAISICVAADPSVAALPGRSKHLVVFDDVDVSVIVEKVVQGRRVPLPLVIRRANRKTGREIQNEVRDAQRQRVKDEGDYVLTDNPVSSRAMRLFYAMPGSIRVFLLRRILRNPFRRKKLMGTIVVTSLGSVGRLPGWVLPKSMHNLCFALGSVIRKPWVVGDSIEIRDILHLTVLFDHDTVDGAPAARFVVNLVDYLEGRGDVRQNVPAGKG